MIKKLAVTWLCCVVLFLGGTAAFAQTTTASVRGTVTDASGAVLPGANVTATNVDTGVTKQSTTNQAGLYNIQFLNLGQYTITTTAPGFDTSTIGPFLLTIDQIATVDAKLSVGKATTSVTVDAGAGAILNTENATLGTSISANELSNMPLPGQNALYATMFVPGALNPTVSSMSSAYRTISPDEMPSFNGNRQQGNNFVLDGIEINETVENLSGYKPNPFSLQETRIITGNADAEYGNVDGAEILMVTRAGTNKFHGNAFEFYEDENFAANTYSNNYSNVPKAKFTQHQFGGQVGGPVFRNKLFFFGDYSGLRNKQFNTDLTTVATQAERNGNFSAVAAGSPFSAPNPIFDTSNGLYNNGVPEQPYPNYTLPAIVNPVAIYIFAHPELYPLPNRNPDAGFVTRNNYQQAVTNTFDNNQGDGRLDYTLSTHDTFMIKGTYGDAYDYPSNAVIPVQIPEKHDYPFAMGVVDWIHTFSPSFVNELRGGYSRIVQTTTAYDPSGAFGTHGDTLLGIGYPGTQPLAGFTNMYLQGTEISSFGTPIDANSKTIDNNFDYTDNITWVHGKHITRAGAQFVRYQENYNTPSNLGGNNGYISYYADYTANYACYGPGGSYTGTCSNGDGLADFELNKGEVSLLAQSTGLFGSRQWRDAYYVQDDWKVLPNLTLNLGLRYAYDQPMYEAHDKMSSINLKAAYFAPVAPTGPDSTPYLLLAGKNGNSRALVNPFYGQFMPRLGFAWQFDPRIVFSGGYSITDDYEGTGSGLRMTQNVPFLNSLTNIQHGPKLTNGGTPISVQTGLIAGSGNTQLKPQFDVWDPHFRPAQVQQFNLTTQILLASKTSLRFGYVGQVGNHIAEPRLLNQYIAKVPATCAPGDTTKCVDTVAPYYAVVGGNSQIVETVSEGVENYHALQATLHQQSTAGLEYTVNYTWARAMTDTPAGFLNVDGVNGGGSFAFAQNAYDPHAEYGPAAFDVRHNLSAIVVYQLPFGHDKKYGANWNRLTDEALGGWELSGNVLAHSGFPATIFSTFGATGLNAASDNSNYNYAARANQYFPLKIVGRDLTHWFGTNKPCTSGGHTTQNGVPCAYGKAAQDPKGNGFGSAGNFTERNPGFKNVDLSLFKSFRTFGDQAFKFRVDAYNAFNLVSYGAPNGRVGSGQYGLILSSANNPRQIQFSGVYTF